VWKDVTSALKKQDFRAAGEAKALIEDTQRALRKEREARGEEHVPTLFTWDAAQERWVLRDLDARVSTMRAALRKA
jgi:hypothetical protein